MAKDCGSMKAVNVVMIGVLARKTDFGKEVWLEAIRQNVKPQFIDLNLCAFESGYSYVPE
jgi:indolepyruvate ferredoxin oxidoreductase beta subunit